MLPARTHDLLRRERANGLSLEALVEAASYNMDADQMRAVKFWAQLYTQNPPDTNPVGDTESDAAILRKP